MERLHQALVLDLLPQLGVYRLTQRIHNGDPFQLFSHSHDQLRQLGFNHSQIQTLKSPPRDKLKAVDSWLTAQPNRWIISYYDDDYPALLKEISAPPMLLFCQGNKDLLSTPQIAIVGSRAATISGKETAKRLAGELSQYGFCITSGLATGIDSYAHQGALVQQGDTIAVMGCGLNIIYPKSNSGLSKKIAHQGLLVSEFWPNTPPKAAHFPRRNRIVSGLSLGVLVIEAAKNSGSLITARLAAEQNREVFAIPGSINNPKAQGCHQLISQGAKLITNATDVLVEFSQYEIQPSAATVNDSTQAPSKSNSIFTPVLDCIDYETTSIDTICQRSQLAIELLLQQLLALELAGLIISAPGGFIRAKEDI